MEKKVETLKRILESYKSVVVAYSGGIDSTLLCFYAKKILKDNFLAAITISETLTKEEIEEATEIAEKYNWPLIKINSNELESDIFTENNPEKCRWCKDIKIKEIKKVSDKINFEEIITGDNTDDLKDYRPGFKQAQKLGVKTPFIEAGINKHEIRKLSKEIGLPNHDKPSTPCLASRIPYGIKITKERLKTIENAERFIKDLGYKTVRVRHENKTAKIEIEKQLLTQFISTHSELVVEKFKQLGYTYVVLDLQGYEMGKLNKVLNSNES